MAKNKYIGIGIERKFFNSIESQILEREKDKLRKQQKRAEKRAADLAKCQPQIEELSAKSKFAEYLAAQVTPIKTPESVVELSKLTEALVEKVSIHRFMKSTRKE